jgi:hypothetical protein
MITDATRLTAPSEAVHRVVAPTVATREVAKCGSDDG